MNSRRLGAALSLPLALILAACSSTSGSGSTGDSASGGASTPSGSSAAGSSGKQAGGGPAATGTPSDAAGLGAFLQTGLAGVTSAHIELNVALSGQSITGSGDEKLSNSKLTGLDLTETIPGAGDIRLIIVDDKTYAKLPSSLNTSGKPYVLVSTNSSNATIKQLASTIESAQSSASLGTVGTFIKAASSVKVDGAESVNGVQATHYSVVVDPQQLPSSYPGKAAIAQSGLKSLPVELYVDQQGRPVEVTEKITVSGQTVSTKITVSKYNAPVNISAPPADQVSTD